MTRRNDNRPRHATQTAPSHGTQLLSVVFNLVVLCVILCLLVNPNRVDAQARAIGESSISASASLRTGPIFPPGRWISVDVRISNPTPNPINGDLIIQAVQTTTGVIDITRPVRVPGMSQVTVELLTPIPEPEVRRNQNAPAKPNLVMLFRGADKQVLVREPVMAISDAGEMSSKRDATGAPGVVMVQSRDDNLTDPAFEGFDLADELTSALPYRVSAANIDVSGLPRRVQSYDAARIVCVSPDVLLQLDPAQRDALLTHVRSGATLLLDRPESALSASLSSSWFATYLPASPLMDRYTTALATPEFGELTLRTASVVFDLQPADDAVVVASTPTGAVAVYKNLGLGRVVITGWRVNALATTSAGYAPMWTSLLGTDRRAFHDPTLLAGESPLVDVLPLMIGATAPPWRVAGGVVVGYVAVVAMLLMFSGTTRRPGAFAVSAILSVIVFGTLLGMGFSRTTTGPITLARLSVVDLAGDTERRSETLTFFGPQSGDLSLTLAPGALATPGATRDTPVVSMFPLKIDGLSSSSGRIDDLIRVDSTRTTDTKTDTKTDAEIDAEIDAELRFTDQGAIVVPGSVDKNVEKKIGAMTGVSVLVGQSMMPLTDGGATVGPRNPVGDFTAASGVVTSELDQLHGRILRLSQTRPTQAIGNTPDEQPILIGFDSTPAVAPAAVASGPVVERAQTLYRIPLRVQRPAPNTTVRIDPGFLSIRREASPSLPYSPNTQQWSDSTQNGPWLIGIAAPEGLGKLRPKTLLLDINARLGSGYVMTLRRAQCDNGAVRENTTGPTIDVPAQGGTITIELAATDIDTNGWVWLALSVMPTAQFQTEVAGSWRMLSFNPTLIATTTDQSATHSNTWELPARRAEK